MVVYWNSLFAQTTYNLPNASEHSDGFLFNLVQELLHYEQDHFPVFEELFPLMHQDFGMYFTSTAYRGQQMEGFDILLFRYLALSKEKLRIAPTLTFSDHWGISRMDYRATAGLGVAIETGANKWLWDLSINVVGWQYRPQYLEGPISKMTVLDSTYFGDRSSI